MLKLVYDTKLTGFDVLFKPLLSQLIKVCSLLPTVFVFDQRIMRIMLSTDILLISRLTDKNRLCFNLPSRLFEQRRQTPLWLLLNSETW